MPIKFLFRHRLAKISTLYFLLVIIPWWLKIFLFGSTDGLENYLFNLAYIVFTIIGGVSGVFIISKKWGGWSSYVGKGVIFLGLGLLAYSFGVFAWAYFNIVAQVEVPYPSIADFGFFFPMPLYALAMYNFSRAVGAHYRLKTLSGRLQVVIIPGLLVLSAYILFIKDVGFDFASEPIRTFLDIGYPAGDAFSVSLGILTYSLSRGMLGGKMKKRVLFIAGALVLQFLTDYSFLYTVGVETYYNAGWVDLMYAASFYLMTLGILSFAEIEK